MSGGAGGAWPGKPVAGPALPVEVQSVANVVALRGAASNYEDSAIEEEEAVVVAPRRRVVGTPANLSGGEGERDV